MSRNGRSARPSAGSMPVRRIADELRNRPLRPVCRCVRTTGCLKGSVIEVEDLHQPIHAGLRASISTRELTVTKLRSASICWCNLSSVSRYLATVKPGTTQLNLRRK